MFGEKTLTDVVKGIRASKRDTGLYISSCIGEIKTELQSSDLSVKSNALQKLTFLQMMGYSMTYASFACIEVMSSPRFAHKRIGYLAGCQGCFNTSRNSSRNISTEIDTNNNNNNNEYFTSNSDDTTNSSGLLLLTINLLKKELRGASTFGYNGCYEAGLAVNFLSNVVTEDLARELLPEVSALTQHPSHAYLRKKAVLCLFQIYRKYPQALRLSFDKLQTCLNDTDPAVVSCAVNVITELSTHNNPKNYLLLAPTFFQLLLHSSNNWMLIKVVKLLGSLLSEEPRLARKLLEPLANIVRTTQAKSLLFEALYTITLALPYCSSQQQQQQQTMMDIIELCSHHLQTFLEDSDPNLKYLGLVGFASLVENASSSSSVLIIIKKEHKELILKCLSDNDSTIRSRALELCSTFATKKNVVELITQLLSHVRVCDEEPYRKELIARIISICKSNRFALLETSDNFAWYLTHVLLELSSYPTTTTTTTTTVWEEDDEDNAELVAMGSILAQQIMEIALRVFPIRPLAVQKMTDILRNEWILRTTDTIITAENCSIHKRIHKSVLSSAAWIVGEYSHLLVDIIRNSDEGTTPFNYSTIIQALLHPNCSEQLAASTQAVYVQSALKVFASACCCCREEDKDLQQCILAIRQYLPYFTESTDADVQERAISFYKLVQEMGLFAEEVDSMLQMEPKPSSTDSEQEQATRNNNNTTNTSIQAISTTGNLLNFDLGEQQDLPPPPPSSSNLEQQQKESLNLCPLNRTRRVAKCRDISKDLSTILTPEPMKPISAKVQKRLEQPSILLDAALDLSIFDSLINHDNASKAMMIYYHIQSNVTTSIEDVTFARQTSFKYHHTSVEESVVAAPVPSHFDIFTESGPVKQQQQTYNSNRSGANAPFYLSSSSSLTAAVATIDPNTINYNNTIAGITNASMEQQQPSNKFGTIQLMDEDETPYMNEVNGRNNKKDNIKKKKSKKSATITSSEAPKMSEADMAVFFSSGTNTTSTSNATVSKAVVYKSDDEEDHPNINHIKMKKANKAFIEFKSLANVDLTTPLGEEEIMPVRTHRQVPVRTEMDTTKPKTSSKDSSNVRRKKKKSKEVTETPVATGDLLNFDVFDAVPSTMNAPPQISPFDMLSTTDDLLLPLSTIPKGNDHFNSMSVAAMNNATNTMDTILPYTDAPKSTSSKHPWLHATVKADAYALSYKVYITSKGKSPTASILLRISNNGNSILRGLSLLFPTLQNEEVKISESIAPGSSIESPIKIGPFSYEKDESSGEYMSREIKGCIVVSKGNAVKIPFKVVLPCCLLFVKLPVPPSQDRIMEELSTGKWSSHSIKLHASTNQTTEDTIRLLGSFCKAQVIGDGISSHIKNAAVTFATATKKGNQVRALIKMTDKHIKIDVKCSNGNDLVGRALTSDLKRLLL